MANAQGLIVASAWKPRAYQKRGIRFLLEHASAALFWDPGLGKTSATLGAFKLLKEQGLVRRGLIIAPLRPCYTVWPEEAKLWRDFSGLRISVLHGSGKEQRLQEDADLYVINPEGLPWLFDPLEALTRTGKKTYRPNVRRIRELAFDLVVFDELTQFKSAASRRFKIMRGAIPYFRRRWGLTGTPAPKGLLDLFSQVYLLDEGNALGRYITHYQDAYFLPSLDGWGWVPKKGAQEKIEARLRPLVHRLSAEDHLDLPPLIETNLYVDLPFNVAPIYAAMQEALSAALAEDETICAGNAAGAVNKCRQIASGAVYLSQEESNQDLDSDNWKPLHDAKLFAALELADELQGQPLLIAYEFRHDLERLRGVFGSVPYIGGGVSAKSSKEIIGAWNAGEVPILLAHPAALGHGLNLQGSGASQILWFSLTWNLELYAQFNARLHRQGTTASRIVVHRLLAKGTVDEVIARVLVSKDKTQRALLLALKEHLGNRGPKRKAEKKA